MNSSWNEVFTRYSLFKLVSNDNWFIELPVIFVLLNLRTVRLEYDFKFEKIESVTLLLLKSRLTMLSLIFSKNDRFLSLK